MRSTASIERCARSAELDQETGYAYYGARYYDNRLSTFLSVDALSMSEPSINGYAFVGNNPLSYVDPDGNFRIPTEFRNAYPNIIRYIEENLYQQLSSDDRFYNTMREAFAQGEFSEEFTGISFTKEMFVEIFSKNSGPTLIARRDPGGLLDAKGKTVSPGGSYIRPVSEFEIELNSVLLQGVEDALADENRTSGSKQVYLFILLKHFYTNPFMLLKCL